MIRITPLPIRSLLAAALIVGMASACVHAQTDERTEEAPDAPLHSEDAAYSVFLLIKATPAWLALAPEARFAWLDETVQPLLVEHPEVSMRFRDDYFLVPDVLPGIENAYAEAYDRPAY